MGGLKLGDKKKKKNELNTIKSQRDIELAMRRQMAPENFRLKKHPIAIDVVDRTYGIVCSCGSTEFSEDEKFEKLFCSQCQQILAVRAAEIGWITKDL
jgi:hypothetical protein